MSKRKVVPIGTVVPVQRRCNEYAHIYGALVSCDKPAGHEHDHWTSKFGGVYYDDLGNEKKQ